MIRLPSNLSWVHRPSGLWCGIAGNIVVDTEVHWGAAIGYSQGTEEYIFLI